LGTLFVVATPIGNLRDISERALDVLRTVPFIAAEDTRHSRRLLEHFGIRARLVSYHQHNQRRRRDELIAALAHGDVALITDAGTPAISDPGTDLVAAALEAGFPVSPIPGPSSLTAAVSASGLIDGPFLTLGFLPRASTDRAVLLGRAAASGFPLVIFESAQRVSSTLQELLHVLGNRSAVILRELTKLHEEIVAGTLAELVARGKNRTAIGEYVVVIAGSSDVQVEGQDVRDVLQVLRKSGLSPSQSAREAAAMTGRARSELYQIAMSMESEPSVGLEGELALPNQDALQQALGDKKCPQR
jgi:16S rRNA (cytidine1402-2'-O)-methyltransferase